MAALPTDDRGIIVCGFCAGPAGGTQGDASASGTKTYVLRNALPVALREEVMPPRGAQRALGMVVLALLHLEGGKMEEGKPDKSSLALVYLLNVFPSKM